MNNTNGIYKHENYTKIISLLFNSRIFLLIANVFWWFYFVTSFICNNVPGLGVWYIFLYTLWHFIKKIIACFVFKVFVSFFINFNMIHFRLNKFRVSRWTNELFFSFCSCCCCCCYICYVNFDVVFCIKSCITCEFNGFFLRNLLFIFYWQLYQ